MAEQEQDQEELTPEEQAAAEVAQKAAKRKRLLLLGGLVVAIVTISIIVTLVLLFLLSGPSETEGADGVEPVKPAAQPAIYYPLKPSFVANYDVRGRQRFLQLDVTLMVRDNSLIPSIELHMPAIRNSLVMLLAGQIFEELQTAEGKELLRQQALFAVQGVLEREVGKPGVEQVLFTGFVMQ